MDKTTKAFVIAACSIVISIPVFWIGSWVWQSSQKEQQRRVAVALADEKHRQSMREWPCKSRAQWEADELFGNELVAATDSPQWIDMCIKATVPVENF